MTHLRFAVGMLLLAMARIASAQQISLSSAATAPGVLTPEDTSAVRPFAVDSATEVSFFIVSQLDVNVEVVFPTSFVLTAATASSIGAGFYELDLNQLSGEPNHHVSISVPNPPPGNYDMRLTAAGSLSESGSFTITMIPDSEIRAAAAVPEADVVVNRRVAITALAFEGTSPVMGVSASATNTSFPAEPPVAPNQERPRLLVMDMGGSATFADGPIIVCRFDVPSTAANGFYPLWGQEAYASDGQGNPFATWTRGRSRVRGHG
jgi:hypothetical protein